MFFFLSDSISHLFIIFNCYVLHRLQDIGLMHMRYALESSVVALGVMERGLGEANEAQFHRAVCYLKDLQSHVEAVGSAPRKVRGS